MSDPYDLARFVVAQEAVFDGALAELRAGDKRGHWMWFVFPQIAGLGHSPTARHYAIRSIEEARAYLAHPLLGPRYAEAVTALDGAPAGLRTEQVLGGVDAMKLRSSLTLFGQAGSGAAITAALARWFGGREDEATLRLIGAGAHPADQHEG